MARKSNVASRQVETRAAAAVSRSIRIAENLELDERSATQKFGIIARSEAGKTYLAGKLVEGLHGLGCQVIVFDPVGNWWGLTLAANGEDAGLPFVVFGGRRGHLPLTVDSGRRIARLVIERNLSAVLDLTELRKRRRAGRGGEAESEFQRFVADFQEEALEASQADPRPRMAVYDEAQKMLPQLLKDGGNRMLDAGEDLVRTGRNYGWGCVQMSQRPQSINKEVLSQVECFFVGQLTEAPARQRLREWVIEKHADVKAEFDQLAQLERGEFVCWSPQWLRMFRKIRVLPKWTYDASRTPELGAGLQPAGPQRSSISAGELAALRALLLEGAAEPEQASAGAAAAKEQRVLLQHAEEGRRKAELQVEALRQREAAWRSALAELHERLGELLREDRPSSAGGGASRSPAPNSGTKRETTESRATEISGSPRRTSSGKEARSSGADAGKSRWPVRRSRGEGTSRSSATDAGSLGKCARALLAALLQHGDLSLQQAAIVARYAGSSPMVSKAASQLRAAGLISGTSAMLSATAAGRAHPQMRGLEPLPVGPALAQWWLGQLGKCSAALLQQLLKAHPRAISLERACAGTGYDATQPIVAKSVGMLRTMALVEGRNEALTANARLAS